MSTQTKTIVLVHGLWVTPLSWESFRAFYESRGYRVLAPAWPGIRGSVAEMRRSPETLNGVGAAEVVEHYAQAIRQLSEPPIIIGHSYGGLITQMLLDRGFGAAGVAIDSVPPKGIWILPLSTNLALVPALVRPATFRTTFLFTFAQWWKVFANTLPEATAREAYAAQAIPASGRAIFQAALANITPGAVTAVNYRNPDRAPLLVVGGGKDVIMPAALSRKIYRKHAVSPARTDYKEFAGRSHYLIAEPGWQDVASDVLAWAEQHARR